MLQISLYIMAAAYILAGLNHFRAPGFYRPMMPPYIPKHNLMIALSGAAEVILGSALFFQPVRALAAWAIILMLLVFYSVHIYMWQNRKTVFAKVPPAILIGRLPLQLVLIYWAYLYT